MLDWKRFSIKPDRRCLEDYPTIVDIMEDILETEEEYPQYPLAEDRTFLYKVKEPGHFCLLHDDDPEKIQLFPTGRNAFSFYRGESKYYDKSIPSLLRIKDDKQLLLAHLQRAELECVLSLHPVIREFLMMEFKHPMLVRSFMLPVDYDGLAQHYGIPTKLLDLTNDKWSAAFFAVTNYTDGVYDLVEPTPEQTFGSFYRLIRPNYYDKSISHPVPVGMHYFDRPGRQSAFTLDLGKYDDFLKFPQVERIYFRHDKDANSLVYDLCQQGRRYFPKDTLSSLVDELRNVDTFSERAVNMCRLAHYRDKSPEEMKTFLRGYDIKISPSPVVSFKQEQLEKDWAYWQNEGRYRYHDKLVILPMSSQFE